MKYWWTDTSVFVCVLLVDSMVIIIFFCMTYVRTYFLFFFFLVFFRDQKFKNCGDGLKAMELVKFRLHCFVNGTKSAMAFGQTFEYFVVEFEGKCPVPFMFLKENIPLRNFSSFKKKHGYS